jgi:CRISPR/Cas system-associated exonuclease Cas4 (RecB family)
MLSLSPSTLNLYLECKRCFWLQFNRKIERPRGIFPSLPGGIDLILKSYFNLYRSKRELPPLIAGKLKGVLADIPLNLEFIDVGNNLKIKGKLDDCLKTEDGLYVPLDHKTRGSLPGNIEYSYNYYKVQMDTYSLLLAKSGYSIKNIAYIVYYSPTEGMLHKGFPFKVEVHKLETNPYSAHRLFIEAKKCIEGPLPESSPQCEFCQWQTETAEFLDKNEKSP